MWKDMVCNFFKGCLSQILLGPVLNVLSHLAFEVLWLLLLNFTESVGGKDWSYFSALCWMFGRRLYEQYGIPIGLISSSYGGTRVEAWSSPETNSKCNGRYENAILCGISTVRSKVFMNEPSKLSRSYHFKFF